MTLWYVNQNVIYVNIFIEKQERIHTFLIAHEDLASLWVVSEHKKEWRKYERLVAREIPLWKTQRESSNPFSEPTTLPATASQAQSQVGDEAPSQPLTDSIDNTEKAIEDGSAGILPRGEKPQFGVRYHMSSIEDETRPGIDIEWAWYRGQQSETVPYPKCHAVPYQVSDCTYFSLFCG